MEIDKKALAVTRLVSVIYSWDPNLGTTLKNQTERKSTSKIIKGSITKPRQSKKSYQVVLAMTLHFRKSRHC